jgi:hypothetical protein
MYFFWTGGVGGVGFTPHVITVKAGEVFICAVFEVCALYVMHFYFVC